jgi:hypothetical protein
MNTPPPSALGAVVSEHRPVWGWTAWIAVTLACLGVWLAVEPATRNSLAPTVGQLVLRGVVVAACLLGALFYGRRVIRRRTISVTLCEQGLLHRMGGQVTPVPWSAVQNVRTFRPRGVLAEAVLVTASGECLLHDELTDFAALVKALVHHGVMQDGMYTGRHTGMDPR